LPGSCWLRRGDVVFASEGLEDYLQETSVVNYMKESTYRTSALEMHEY
jgi:hypothetical protein